MSSRASKKQKTSATAATATTTKPAPVVVVEQPQPQPQTQMSLQVFSDFMCAKAFDVLSENRYRKHLVRSKDAGDEWALVVHESVTIVQNTIKGIHKLVSKISESPTWSMSRACMEVLNSTAPPVKVRDGWGVCCISGVRSEGCIEICKATSRAASQSASGASSGLATAQSVNGGGKLLKNQGQEDQLMLANHNNNHASNLNNTGSSGNHNSMVYQQIDLVVHPRFGHFFLMLWFVCKIEHVIRNSTRCWMDSVLQKNQSITVSALCKLFEGQKSFIEKNHTIFLHGLSHVTLSLTNHLKEAQFSHLTIA